MIHKTKKKNRWNKSECHLKYRIQGLKYAGWMEVHFQCVYIYPQPWEMTTWLVKLSPTIQYPSYTRLRQMECDITENSHHHHIKLATLPKYVKDSKEEKTYARIMGLCASIPNFTRTILNSQRGSGLTSWGSLWGQLDKLSCTTQFTRPNTKESSHVWNKHLCHIID